MDGEVLLMLDNPSRIAYRKSCETITLLHLVFANAPNFLCVCFFFSFILYWRKELRVLLSREGFFNMFLLCGEVSKLEY